MAEPNHFFQKLCHEAVLACGGDMAAVERYVFERIAAMDETSRATIKRDLERVLAFRPAPSRLARPH